MPGVSIAITTGIKIVATPFRLLNIERQTGSGNQGGDFNAAGHDWLWYVVDYNTECMSVEKYTLFHKLVVTIGSTGPWSPGPLLIPTPNLVWLKWFLYVWGVASLHETPVHCTLKITLL